VVDDEPLVLSTIRRTLEVSGYAVACARNLDEAVNVLKERIDDVDVAIVDLTIDEEGAPPVVAALRQIKEGLPVLLISGYPLDEHSDVMQAARADGFISKPFRPEELERVIRRVTTTADH
jgi:DNA-binding response OmpR family regulator